MCEERACNEIQSHLFIQVLEHSNGIILNISNTKDMINDFKRRHPSPSMERRSRWWIPTSIWESTSTGQCPVQEKTEQERMLSLFYQPVVASALFFGVVHWGAVWSWGTVICWISWSVCLCCLCWGEGWTLWELLGEWGLSDRASRVKPSTL